MEHKKMQQEMDEKVENGTVEAGTSREDSAMLRQILLKLDFRYLLLLPIDYTLD